MLDNKDFEEKAWGNMLELLEKEMPEKKAFPWFRSMLLLLLIVFIGGGITYSFLGSNDNTELTASSTDVKVEQITNAIETQSHASLVESKSIETETTNQNSLPINSIEKTKLSENTIKAESSNVESIQTRSVNIESTNQMKADFHIANTNESVNSNSSKEIAPFSAQSLGKQLFAESLVNPNSNGSQADIGQEQNRNQGQSQIASITNLNTISLTSFSNPIDIKKLQSVSEENKISLVSSLNSRITSLYAVSEVGYNTDFTSPATSIGLIGEIGATNSPLSFATGLVYENYSLQSIDFPTSEASLLEQDEVVTVPDGTVDAIDATGLRSISYLSVPLQFHYRFNYIKIGLGIENKFLIRQGLRPGYERADEFTNVYPQTNEYFKNQTVGPNKYHLTANQSIAIRLRPRIEMGLHFQYDLTGIFVESNFTTSNVNTSNRLDNIGISLAYKLK